jgi:hypothetical protein
MIFDYEQQMVKPVEQWLKFKGLATKREFPTPWGICDLVGCSLNKNRVKQRLALGQTKPIGSQLRVFLLSQIPECTEQRSVSVRTLKVKFGTVIDEGRIVLEIDRLLSDKFIQETSPGRVQKLNGWVPLHKKLIAVELKLTRINDALKQAATHLEFADESFVGLPADTAKRLMNSKKKKDFVNNGVGILAVDPSGCKLLFKSNRAGSSPNPLIQQHAVERFWRTYPKDN